MSAALQSLMRDAPESGTGWARLDQLCKFIFIGAAGAVAFVVLSSTMIWFDTGFADWVVNTGCYGALIVPVYLLHRRFSFQSKASHGQALPRYLAVQAMALVLAAAFSYVIHGVLLLPAVAASMLVILLTSGISFVVLRGWAFARHRLAASAIA